MEQEQLLNLLKLNKKAVDEVVQSFLPDAHERWEISLLYDMMRHYPMQPGKGLRPSLCILTNEALGGKKEQVFTTAAALELFHNWVLIHDDVEDRSDLRRGEPALHKKYGVPLAINAGDALHGEMWELLLRNRTQLGDAKTLAVLGEVTHMISETTAGQHMELSWVENRRWDVSEEDYFYLCERKTSWYTCISPSRIGAIIADAPTSVLDSFIPFGRDLGLAFQIQDDVLNLVGDESQYGKELAGDLFEGKRTLVLIRLLNTISNDEKTRVLKIMQKDRSEKTHTDVNFVLGLMKKHDSIAYAKHKAIQFASAATRRLQKISKDFINDEAKDALEALVRFMVFREW